MILDLVFKTKFLFWSSIILGSLSVVILGYSVVRYVFFLNFFFFIFQDIFVLIFFFRQSNDFLIYLP